MDKINFSSEYHQLGNYLFKFSRIDVSFNKYINIIEIFTEDKVKITELKLSTLSCTNLYKKMYNFNMYTENFIYEVPLYKNNEVTRISCICDTRLICEQMEECVIFRIEKENTDGQSFNIEIVSTFYDFEKFVFIFYFLLLIDVIDEYLGE